MLKEGSMADFQDKSGEAQETVASAGSREAA
jgi:hypothetical protein